MRQTRAASLEPRISFASGQECSSHHLPCIVSPLHRPRSEGRFGYNARVSNALRPNQKELPSDQFSSRVPSKVEQVGRALTVRRAEAPNYHPAAREPLHFLAKITFRQATVVPFHLNDLAVPEKVIDMPPHPLLSRPQVPRNPGLKAAPGAACVDVVARGERESPKTADPDDLAPLQPDEAIR